MKLLETEFVRTWFWEKNETVQTQPWECRPTCRRGCSVLDGTLKTQEWKTRDGKCRTGKHGTVKCGKKKLRQALSG